MADKKRLLNKTESSATETRVGEETDLAPSVDGGIQGLTIAAALSPKKRSVSFKATDTGVFLRDSLRKEKGFPMYYFLIQLLRFQTGLIRILPPNQGFTQKPVGITLE